MQKFYSLIYYILIVFLTYVISLLWLSYFIKNFYILNIICLIISIATCTFILKKNSINKNKEKITKEYQSLYSNLKFKFMFSHKLESTKFIQEIIDPTLEIKKNGEYLLDSKHEIIHIPSYYKEYFELSDLTPIIQKYIGKYSKIIIYCIKINDNIKELTNMHLLSSSIYFMTLDRLINENITLLQNNINETNIPESTKPKLTLKSIWIKISEPNKWRIYLLYGLITLILNRFNNNKIYFSIFTTLFWILAIICLIKKLFLKKS